MKEIVIISMLGVLLSGCVASKQQNFVMRFIDVDSDTIKGVIAPKGYGDWTITNFDFEDLEDRLEKYLREDIELELWARDLADNFRSYYRQYIGVIENGRKVIWINFFCEPESYWKEDFVQVWDGGDCYFQVYYDLESQKFSGLWINTEA